MPIISNPSETCNICSEKEFINALAEGDYNKLEELNYPATYLELTIKKGRTLLHMAAKEDDLKLATFLLEKGAKPSPKDENGETPLHYACEYKYIDVVKVLVKYGASINLEDNDGTIPLHIAVKNNYLANTEKTVKFLIEAGADCTHMNKDGLTVFDISDRNYDREMNTSLYDQIIQWHLQKESQMREQLQKSNEKLLQKVSELSSEIKELKSSMSQLLAKAEVPPRSPSPTMFK